LLSSDFFRLSLYFCVTALALDALPIDPYAAESASEFFAVASEAFFETPELLGPAYPDVYAQLKLFYRQDPAARLP